MKKKNIFLIFLIFVFLVICFFVNNLGEQYKKIEEIIPKLYVYGNLNDFVLKGDIRQVEVKYFSNDYNFEEFATLKIQGDSSTLYDKKNFNIVFYSDKSYSSKKKIDVGFGKYSKYTLKADWTDASKSRNVVTANLYKEAQKKYDLLKNTLNNGVVDGYPIEIYVNDEFYGIYNLTTSKDYIYGLDEDNKNNLAIMGKEPDKIANFIELADSKWESFEVEVGLEYEYSLSKLNRLISFVKDSDIEYFEENFDKYINLDSALNYYCFIKFAELFDNINKNLMLITYDGNYWYLTLYDLDLSWGVAFGGEYLLDYTDMLDSYISESMLWSKFEVAFADEIVDRYFELRESILTKENILDKFYEYYNLIPESTFDKEIEKWGPLVGYGMDQIEEFLDTRIELVDEDIISMKSK